jgi:hypothetical protein
MQSDLLLSDQMYHLTLRLFTTVADVIDYLEYISENTVGENHFGGANTMAGKGQITSERASSGSHATYRTRTS